MDCDFMYLIYRHWRHNKSIIRFLLRDSSTVLMVQYVRIMHGMWYWCSGVPNFSPLSLYSQPLYKSRGICREVCQRTPNTTRSRVQYHGVWFRTATSIFPVKGNFETSVQNYTNIIFLLTLHGQIYPHLCPDTRLSKVRNEQNYLRMTLEI